MAARQCGAPPTQQEKPGSSHGSNLTWLGVRRAAIIASAMIAAPCATRYWFLASEFLILSLLIAFPQMLLWRPNAMRWAATQGLRMALLHNFFFGKPEDWKKWYADEMPDLEVRFRTITGELARYGAALDERPQLVVLNKIDLLETVPAFDPHDERVVRVVATSCATGPIATVSTRSTWLPTRRRAPCSNARRCGSSARSRACAARSTRRSRSCSTR